MSIIKENDHVLIESSDGKTIMTQVTFKGTVKLGRRLKFSIGCLIGKITGSVFEVTGKGLVQVDEALIHEETIDVSEGMPIEDNRDIIDTNTAQSLSAEDIKAMKSTGASGSEIIAALARNSSTFASKTDFSKAKWMKRKHKKYSPRVTVKHINSLTLSHHLHHKGGRVNYIRGDSLARMLALGNIHGNLDQVIVCDTMGGLVVGSVLEKMGGLGRVMAGYDGMTCMLEWTKKWNFSKEALSNIFPFPFSMVSHDGSGLKPVVVEEEELGGSMVAEERGDLNGEEIANILEKRRLRKIRKAAVRESLLNGSEALIVATKYTPWPIVKALLPLLRAGRPFVVYSDHLEPLSDLFIKLAENNLAVNISVSETWQREYQVLPNRTHPVMTMPATSGFILSAMKIEFDSEKTPPSKKQRIS